MYQQQAIQSILFHLNFHQEHEPTFVNTDYQKKVKSEDKKIGHFKQIAQIYHDQLNLASKVY